MKLLLLVLPIFAIIFFDTPLEQSVLPLGIAHFGKYHNTLFPLGTYNGPKRKQKQCLCKIFGGKQLTSIMVFSEMAFFCCLGKFQERCHQPDVEISL